MSEDKDIVGFEIPLHRSLTEKQMMAGAPSEAVGLVLTFTALFVFAFKTLWILPLSFAAHLALVSICQNDPDFIFVLKGYLKQKSSLRS